MTPAAYCRRKTLEAHSSFFLPFFFLPPPRRGAMYAVYAFCREVDDLVDSGLPVAEAAARLHEWRHRLQQAFAGERVTHPIVVELAHYRTLFDLPVEPFFDILSGMEMDLYPRRYQTLAELQLYCYRVAVTVGLIALRIFTHGRPLSGWSPEREKQFADRLGVALQLTNIIRDVAEDARMGRLYLPQAWLAEAGVTEEEIIAGRWSPPLAAVLRRLAVEAEQAYQQADTLIRLPEERQALLPALLMGAIYHRCLQRVRQLEFFCFGPRVRLSLREKLLILWRSWRAERRRWRMAKEQIA
ncbi:MAG: presqualene diphosphate synthase HpnD [Magnetococcales bacterium]|nr:presqualene diphosphate synthase HpnD [Magnetococcales bacterium]